RRPGAGRLEQPVDGSSAVTVDPLDLAALSRRELLLPSLERLLPPGATGVDDQVGEPELPDEVEPRLVREKADALGQPRMALGEVAAEAVGEGFPVQGGEVDV